MRKILVGIVAAASVFGLAGAASAANPVQATYYSNFSESAAGISFANPFFSETLPDINFDFGNIGCPANARPSASCGWGGDFTGAISVAAAGTYALTVGSDDASYLFIDNILIGGLPGSHGYYEQNFSTVLAAGSHNFELQYYNTFCCGAAIHFTLGEGVTYTPPTSAPEPSAWALMIGGFGLAGATLRRRRTVPTTA